MLIAIEGIDGSGKGTQAKRLVERLKGTGRRTALISFPRYSETTFGRAIGDFLNGRFGTLDQVHPFLAALLFAGDRFESKPLLERLLAENEIVVCDRYVASNLAHQGAKAAPDARTRMIEEIQRIEHQVYGLPHADLNILLQLSVPAAQSLIARKARRDYTERAADLQEADGRYLHAVSDVYRSLADPASADWRVVVCEGADDVRSVDAIADDVWRLVESALGAAASGRGRTGN